MEIGLVVHPSNPVGESIRVLTEFAGRQQRTLIARESDAERVGPGVELVPEDTFADRVDALVALGGDGTMLGAMRLVVGRPVPVLGVNHGNVGFLVEVTPDELPDALDRLVGRPVHAGAAQLPGRVLPGERRGDRRVQRRGAHGGRAVGLAHRRPRRERVAARATTAATP